MKALLIRIASWFPSRLVSDRILPWVTLLLAIFAAGWTLFQYSNSVAIQRATTVLMIHRQFLDTFPDGAQSFTSIDDNELVVLVLQIRCKHYTRAQANGLLPDTLALRDCDTLTIDDVASLKPFSEVTPQSVREGIRNEVEQIEVANPAAARRMITFFRSLQVCVERRQCTRDISAELVVTFIEAMRISDVAKLSGMISDDFSWWIAGKTEYLQTAGEHDKEFFIGFFSGGTDLFPNGAEFVVTGMIAEGDKVAVEANMAATTAMGTQYDNSYHFLFTIEDGKIVRMKEYMDTYHAKTTFGL